MHEEVPSETPEAISVRISVEIFGGLQEEVSEEIPGIICRNRCMNFQENSWKNAMGNIFKKI